MKKVVWEGSSREILGSFPDGVKRDLGTSLMYLQCGALPVDAKPFKTGMAGTWELRARDSSGQYRAIYVCIVNDVVHVLHCFRKTPAKTALADVQLAQARYKSLKGKIRLEKI